jgi:hypothetical protein
MLCFSRASVHPVPSTSCSRWRSTDKTAPTLYTNGASVHPMLKTPQPSRRSLLAFMRPSDRPTLPLDQGVGSSSAEDFVLARLCLDSNWASDRPTVSSLRSSDHPVLLSSLGIGPSVHPTVSTSFCMLRSVPTTPMLCTDGTVGSSDSVFSFPFFAQFWP